jgi:hypothetical protein
VLAVHPRERLLDEARRWPRGSPPVDRWPSAGPSIVSTRLYGGFGEARALSDTLRHALEWSRDVDEGMAAHREGRPPRFTGR